MKYSTILLALLILVSLGCTPKAVKLSPAEQQQAQDIQAGKYPTGEGGSAKTEKGGITTEKGGITEEELAARDKAKALSLKEIMEKSPLKDILFEFDSYVIKTEYFSRLNEIGNWLKQYKDIKIFIEGHCDERGTIEYNLALGQKRAEAVKNYLVKLGVDGSRIKTISFGKELPADPGHVEEAWAKNRRAGFKVEQKG